LLESISVDGTPVLLSRLELSLVPSGRYTLTSRVSNRARDPASASSADESGKVTVTVNVSRTGPGRTVVKFDAGRLKAPAHKR